jgi:hypothetical protein
LKSKSSILFFTLFTVLTVQVAKAQDQNPVTFSDEIFKVPRVTLSGGVNHFGTEQTFTVSTKSTVTIAIANEGKKPTLDVYLLDNDTYSKYETSNSLTNLSDVDSLSKKNTLGYEASDVLTPGVYHLLIRWDQYGLFTKSPAVGLKIVGIPIVIKIPKPIPTPTATFFKRIF